MRKIIWVIAIALLAWCGWWWVAWQISDAAGAQALAQNLPLTMTLTEGPSYAFEARADGFAPGNPTRARLRLPDDFPRAFDSLQLRADITFDTAWDQRALDVARPQPRNIDLYLVEARWGDLRLNMAANLVVDAQGCRKAR